MSQKLIAEYLGWKYVPFNDLQGLKNPGWYKVEESIKTLAPLVYNSKNGWIKMGNKYYKFVCRSHNDLQFEDSMDALLPVIKKLQKSSEVRFMLYDNGGYVELFKGIEFPKLITESFEEKTWVENVFNLVVETIKYIENGESKTKV